MAPPSGLEARLTAREARVEANRSAINALGELTAARFARLEQQVNNGFTEMRGTVTTWHQKPDRVPSAEMQQALDTAWDRAGEGAQARFTRNTADPSTTMEPPSPPFPKSPAHAEDTTTSVVEDLTASASPTIKTKTAEDTADGGFMGWLQVTHTVSAPPDGSDVGQIIRWYRRYEGLTQQQAAIRLNTTQSRLSKLV